MHTLDDWWLLRIKAKVWNGIYLLTKAPTHDSAQPNQEDPQLQDYPWWGKEKTEIYIQHSDFLGDCLRAGSSLTYLWARMGPGIL